MKISRIDHLGIGVESIDAVLPYFENVLGKMVWLRHLLKLKVRKFA